MSEAMTLFSQALEQLRLAALNIPGLTELATYPFLFRPLVMVVLLGVVAGVPPRLACATAIAEPLTDEPEARTAIRQVIDLAI